MVNELGIVSPKRIFFSFSLSLSLSLQNLLSYCTHESIYYSGCGTETLSYRKFVKHFD